MSDPGVGRTPVSGSGPARARAHAPVFPFSAVVGHDDAKLALTLAALDRRIGGVLLRGDKGSAKSTLARGLAALLGPSSPWVELPVSATEDRVVGSIDIEAALRSGEQRFRPGLLADADGGVLYVDEVNLLPDHLVDVLLDVAASGVNRVEREGVSCSHPSRFVLVGSMNPEEGDLRPQLLDRFGLAVDVRASRSGPERAEAVRRRLAYDRDPGGFAAVWASQDADLASRLAVAAPAELSAASVSTVSELCVALGAEGLRADLVICRAAAALAGLQGRPVVGVADIRAVAALALGHRRRRGPLEQTGVDQEEIDRVLDAADDAARTEPAAGSEPASGIGSEDGSGTGAGPGCGSGAVPGRDAGDGVRTRSGPASGPGGNGGTAAGAGGAAPARSAARAEASGSAVDGGAGGSAGLGEAGGAGGPGAAGGRGAGQGRVRGGTASGADGAPDPEPSAALAPGSATPGRGPDGHEVPLPAPGMTGPSGRSGDPLGISRPGPSTARRRSSTADGPRGPVVGARLPEGPPSSVAAGPTLRAMATRLARSAAAPSGRAPGSAGAPGSARLASADLREPVRRQAASNLIILIVDASASMGVERRLAAAKQAVLSLLVDAYQRRDRVALVTFAGSGAEVLLRPTGSVEVARARLEKLRSGGRTPLAAGIDAALGLALQAGASRRPILVLVSDGRATAGPDGLDPLDAARVAAARVSRHRVPAVVVDVEEAATRLGLAAEIAVEMGAPVLSLPQLSGGDLASTIRQLVGS